MGMSFVWQVICQEPKYWTNSNIDLMMALEGKSVRLCVDHEMSWQSIKWLLRYFIWTKVGKRLTDMFVWLKT